MTRAYPLTGTRLVSRSVELPTDVDLVEVAGDDGFLWVPPQGLALAGRGVAAHLPVVLGTRDGSVARAGQEVAAALESIESRGPHAPVAIGALPFRPGAPGRVTVPRVLVCRCPDGTAWLTVTEPDGGHPDPAGLDPEAMLRGLAGIRPVPRRGGDERGGAERPGPGQFQVRSVADRGAWCRLVADAARAVREGRLAKVVLAREVTVEADRPLRVTDVVRHLRVSHPSCMVFAVEGFVGASPELLIERRGEQVRSRPLAGTAARSDSGAGDEGLVARLLASAKERVEHRLVVEAVAAGLTPFCAGLDVPQVPTIVPIGALAHLGTSVEGKLRPPYPSALDLVVALHPTPAVGGTPRGAALDYIAAVEGADRGRYAGPVGWVDANGDGCWAVGIRSAEISGCRARLRAGVGVVAASDPKAELAETELKLQPLLSAIVRP